MSRIPGHITTVFQQCGVCGTVWKTKKHFLGDPAVSLSTYSWNRTVVQSGLPAEGRLVFTHRTGSCGAPLEILASRFGNGKTQSR